MASLIDVARHARVSVSTASRVLNGSAHPVSAAIRDRVEASAAELGYQRSALARALVTRSSRIIGVIVGDIVDPYFAEIVRGVEVEAAAQGYVTIVANADRRPELEVRQLQTLLEHRAAGVVFAGSGIDGAPGTTELNDLVASAVRQGSTILALAPREFGAGSDATASALVFDNDGAAHDLTRYLQDLGHRRIAFVGGIPGLAAGEIRAAAYARAMTERGLEPLVTGQIGFDRTAGRAATLELVGSGGLPDALICCNDEVAVGALAALWSSGVRVPDGVSVASIGGTQGGTVFDLTTMRLPLVELGARAARAIMATADPDDPLPQHELVIRGSTAPRR